MQEATNPAWGVFGSRNAASSVQRLVIGGSDAGKQRHDLCRIVCLPQLIIISSMRSESRSCMLNKTEMCRGFRCHRNESSHLFHHCNDNNCCCTTEPVRGCNLPLSGRGTYRRGAMRPCRGGRQAGRTHHASETRHSILRKWIARQI